MTDYNQLALFYQQVGPYLYGAVHTVVGPLENQQSSAAFIISEQVGGGEIVYGSILNLLEKIVGLHLTSIHRVESMDETAPPAPSLVRHIGDDQSQASSGELIVQYQNEILEDSALLTAMHFRTLNEIFNHRWGKLTLPVYDKADQVTGEIKLQELLNTMVHHRYLAVQVPFMLDIASKDGHLPSQEMFGGKVNLVELTNMILKVVGEIRLKDLIGVLKRSISTISADSKPTEIIFLVQNLHSLARIVRDAMTRRGADKIGEFLLHDVVRRELAERTRRSLFTPVSFSHSFDSPGFKLAHDLKKKRIEVYVQIDEQQEVIEVDHRKLFSLLTQWYGDEPLIEPPGPLTIGYRYVTPRSDG